jgi:DNA polymerase/3'-5' exonuclease PolX
VAPTANLDDPLSDIYGLGPQRLKELTKMGLRTAGDLLRHLETHPDAAPDSSHVYLRHRSDLRERIPLEEGHAFERQLKGALTRFPRLRWEMAGSYRRGAVTQGDWDVLFAHPDPDVALAKVVARLRARGLDLVTFGEGPRKWEGIVRGPSGRFRRLDLRMVAPESYAPALLYFTGSKEHNIRLRQIAKRKGWRLNEYALLGRDGKALDAPDEAALFRLLGVPFVPPPLRV